MRGRIPGQRSAGAIVIPSEARNLQNGRTERFHSEPRCQPERLVAEESAISDFQQIPRCVRNDISGALESVLPDLQQIPRFARNDISGGLESFLMSLQQIPRFARNDISGARNSSANFIRVSP
jgi:hypothetical protein